jgi:hypothetical protein
MHVASSADEVSETTTSVSDVVIPSANGCQFRLHQTRRLVIITMSGVITLDEWANTVTRQIENNLWSWASLYDLSEAESFPCLEEDFLDDMKRFVSDLSRVCGMRGPVAIVVPTRLLDRYRQQFDAYGDATPYVFEVFTDSATAQLWLAGATDRKVRI